MSIDSSIELVVVDVDTVFIVGDLIFVFDFSEPKKQKPIRTEIVREICYFSSRDLF